MQYKVSIIVPIYGVEAYIERCARSLFEQSLDEIQYIFVNDCTKDNSICILEQVINEYPNRKPHVILLHHEKNKGLPFARQTGLKYAVGEYIAHCDSDDWAHKDMYRTLYEKAKENHADAVVCDFLDTDGNNGSHIHACIRQEKDSHIVDMILRKATPSVWTKMFKKDVYGNEIQYPQFSMGEDLVLTTQLLYYSNKIVYVPQPLYYYYNNVESISKHKNANSSVKRFHELKANTEVVVGFLQKNFQDKKLVKNLCNFLRYYTLRQLYDILYVDKKYRDALFNTYSYLPISCLANPLISVKEKIQIILVLFKLYPFKKDRVIVS